MKVASKALVAIVTLTALSNVFSQRVLADQGATNQLLNSVTVQEAFDRAYFKHDPDFFRNIDLDRQIKLFLNIRPPENEITADAERVDKLYKDVLRQQASNDPYLRVQDLPNPYCQSLQGQGSLCGAVPENPVPAAFEPPPASPVMAPPPAPRPVVPALY
jgi:hypothetical protein